MQPIIEREIALRNDPHKEASQQGGLECMVDEISAATGKKRDAIARRIYVIRCGEDSYKPHKPTYPHEQATPLQIKLLEEAGVECPPGLTGGEAYDLTVKHIKRRKITHVTFDVADTIITGLELVHLWHTELADVYFEGQDECLAEAA